MQAKKQSPSEDDDDSKDGDDRSSGDADDDDDEPPLLVALDVVAGEVDENKGMASQGLQKQQQQQQQQQQQHQQQQQTQLPPCPVTILSGFLGSGKTTLIQYILRSPDHGKRIAVIENEFGEGLDVESMIARDGASNESLQDLIELPNGCMCCTVKDSLVATLENLVDRRADLDYILIECSGMANPGPIASLFWLDDALDSRLRLDGIVTLCDALHITEQLQTTEEAAQQIAYADRILLNKIDLLRGPDKAAKIEMLTALIRRLHPMAPIRQTTFSNVPDLDWILDARCFDTDRFHEVEKTIQQLDDTSSLSPLSTPASAHDHSHSHEHHHHGESQDCLACQETVIAHKHTSGITTIALVEPGTLDLQRLNRWLASVLWPNQDATNQSLQSLLQDETKALEHQTKVLNNPHEQRIFRMKGVVSVRQYRDSDTYDEVYVEGGIDDDDDDDNDDNEYRMRDRRRFILQSVHDLWDLYPAGDALQWRDDLNEERISKVVVIGKNLQEANLRRDFQACLVTRSI